MNYSELTDLIQEYLQTTEATFVANIPTFVRQAEERINREVYIPDLRKTSTANLTSSSKYLQKPSDYLATASISVDDGSTEQTLSLKNDDFLREAYPSGTTGVPSYYAHFDDDYWLLAPTPDAAYEVRLTYYFDPESIVTAGTSWLGDNAESVLLYGSLVEAYHYLKGDGELMKMYEERYAKALQHLVDLGMLRVKRDDYREGEIRMRA